MIFENFLYFHLELKPFNEILDAYIEAIAYKYNIQFQFCRLEPTRKFVKYLNAFKELHDPTITKWKGGLCNERTYGTDR